MSTQSNQPESVSGVQLAQGIGHRPAQGFWTEAWYQVIRRPVAVTGIVWVGLVAFFAIFAPLIASGHPLVMWAINEDGTRGAMSSPLVRMLSLADVMLLLWGVCIPVLVLVPRGAWSRGERLRLSVAIGVQLAIAAVLIGLVAGVFGSSNASDWQRALEQKPYFTLLASSVIAVLVSMLFYAISVGVYKSVGRVVLVTIVMLVTIGLGTWKWSPAQAKFEYRLHQSQGQVEALYTLIPFSPNESDTAMYNRSPGATPMNSMWDKLAEQERIIKDQQANLTDEQLARIPITEHTFRSLRVIGNSIESLVVYPISDLIDSFEQRTHEGQLSTLADLKGAILSTRAPRHLLGTDTLGQDVLSQIIHACRLSISIGFVSTGIAVLIGVTIGSLMGYYGGWVDLALYRVVEIFMAIPVLFLLIVAAGVLPRNIYVMMAIIGCFTWTGAARFIRAEFMRLREADYVQAAKVMGLPLWSILFKHMLPNGVTPVLVDASFAIAAAILIEAILSYLGLGPTGQASWGKLLSDATGETSNFLPWLAIYPGAAIFLTTMAYNLIGEALRDAIDPKLKKARV